LQQNDGDDDGDVSMTTFLRGFALFIEALQTKKNYLIGGCGLLEKKKRRRR